MGPSSAAVTIAVAPGTTTAEARAAIASHLGVDTANVVVVDNGAGAGFTVTLTSPGGATLASDLSAQLIQDAGSASPVAGLSFITAIAAGGYTPPPGSSDDSNTGLIVGLVVGGVVLVALIAGAVAYKSKGKEKGSSVGSSGDVHMSNMQNA